MRRFGVVHDISTHHLNVSPNHMLLIQLRQPPHSPHLTHIRSESTINKIFKSICETERSSRSVFHHRPRHFHLPISIHHLNVSPPNNFTKPHVTPCNGRIAISGAAPTEPHSSTSIDNAAH
eukprot:GHVN01084508.1.p1 GENE.GHVN01084508.1~~GHVN01084508.1.p1  ORF type:complete len:121 (-),score=27.43 GHVN01084508.1:2-364(-)